MEQNSNENFVSDIGDNNIDNINNETDIRQTQPIDDEIQIDNLIQEDKKEDNPESDKKPKKKMSLKKKIIMIVSIVLAVCIALGVAGYCTLRWKPFKKTVEDTPSSIKTPEVVKAKSFNLLVCGIDFEIGTARGHLTDIQMYVHIDAKNNKISILQIPRDTYIGLDEGIWTGKINGIYGRAAEDGRKNGIIGLAQYINNAFKLPVDNYATVTMTTFKKVIDQIGGVKMNVPFKLEQDGIVIEAGEQILTGEQAQALVRKRKSNGTGIGFYTGSDTDRLNMQRLFLAALIDNFKKLSFDKAFSAIKTAFPDVDSDLTVGEMKNIAEVVYGMPMKNISVDMLPGEFDRVDTSEGISRPQDVYALHKQQIADLLNDKYRTYTDKIDVDGLEIIERKNTTSRFDKTEDDFEELLKKGTVPGKDKGTSSTSDKKSTSSKSTKTTSSK